MPPPAYEERSACPEPPRPEPPPGRPARPRSRATPAAGPPGGPGPSPSRRPAVAEHRPPRSPRRRGRRSGGRCTGCPRSESRGQRVRARGAVRPGPDRVRGTSPPPPCTDPAVVLASPARPVAPPRLLIRHRRHRCDTSDARTRRDTSADVHARGGVQIGQEGLSTGHVDEGPEPVEKRLQPVHGPVEEPVDNPKIDPASTH